MKHKKLGFTMVEILTVVGIIAILVAVLIPTLTMVRRIAKETQQKAQLTAIDLALIAFKADYGDYPPSGWREPPDFKIDYCGAQKLAEALLGWDLLGFHPDSEWQADGTTKSGSDEIYHENLDPTNNPDDRKNLDERRGPYLDVVTANAFRLGKTAEHDGLFYAPAPLKEDTLVICDVFGTKKIILAGGKTVRAGAPILYYRANTSSKSIEDPYMEKRIYNGYDNQILINLVIDEKNLTPEQRNNTLANATNRFKFFYNYIRDPKVAAIPWPYRPDSYILILAGADGLYGTSDDICNF